MTLPGSVQLVILIIAIVLNTAMALFVLNNNSRSASNRIFGLLSATISVWLFVNYLAIQPGLSADAVLFVERLTIFFAAPLSALFFLFAHTLPRPTLQLSHRKLTLTIIGTLVMMAINISPLAFAGLVYKGGTYSPTPGPGIGFFSLLSTFFSVAAIYLLWRNVRRATSADRQKLRFVLAGLSLMLLLLILTILVPVVFFKSTFFVAFIPLYTLVFLGFTTYAIVRHRLFDMRAVVARSVAYVLILAITAIIYTSVSIIIPSLLLPVDFAQAYQPELYTATAILLAFTFQPLRRFLELATDGVFFRDRYDSQTVLSSVTSILASELHLEVILARALGEIAHNLHLAGGQFVVLDKDETYYQMHSGPLVWERLSADDIHALDHGLLVADELEPGPLKNLLDQHGVRVSLTLRTKEELVGYLFIGDKLSGEMFSSQDLKLLEILRQEMAVAIVNAKAYDVIERFNATLQERVAHATRHLQAANKKLKILDKAKDDFISMASHQLGTPLTAVTGYLSMALDEDKKNMTPAQRDYVTVALESSERLVNMAGDLLNVSRLNAGRFNILLQPVDLTHLIQDEITQLEPSAERKDLKLTFVSPAEPIPDVPLDESKTRQVVMNFIDNAIYYTQKGGIAVTLGRAGDQVELRVKDTGMGVPPAERPKLFSKFYRAENAKTVRPDGTGLGLYLAKQVIEGQGGEIIFESELGKGSTFGFSLPLKASAKLKAAPSKKDGGQDQA
ncbi:MAG TPA: ATP-binding protein [Candidatus Saccharimonadia bacterium]|jgi:signal transduction histidine kinase|nr:ATP-binding protein [Candidatus Saccharimonadia bacterium]